MTSEKLYSSEVACFLNESSINPIQKCGREGEGKEKVGYFDTPHLKIIVKQVVQVSNLLLCRSACATSAASTRRNSATSSRSAPAVSLPGKFGMLGKYRIGSYRISQKYMPVSQNHN